MRQSIAILPSVELALKLLFIKRKCYTCLYVRCLVKKHIILDLSITLPTKLEAHRY